MDWASRTVLSWRLSNTLDAHVCVEALHEALEHDGPPEIFNSDQGSQFTSVDFTDVLKEAGIRISMDGKGRWMDNVFIERLWRSLTYECVYLSEFATGSQARTGIGWWMDFYDRRRPHSALNDRTPAEAYADDGHTRSGFISKRLVCFMISSLSQSLAARSGSVYRLSRVRAYKPAPRSSRPPPRECSSLGWCGPPRGI